MCGSLQGRLVAWSAAGSRVLRGVASRIVSKTGLMALLVACAVGISAGDASATDPAWPSSIPKLFDPQVGLDAVQALLVYVAPLFIFFSLAIAAMYFVWRLVRHYVGARS